MSILDSIFEEYNHIMGNDNSNADKLHHMGLEYMYRKQYDKALDCFNEGAKLDDIDCLTELGVCYYKGLGCDIDYDKAFDYFRHAAVDNSEKTSDAKLFMAIFYAKGLGHLEQSFDKAYALVDEVKIYNHPDVEVTLAQIDNLKHSGEVNIDGYEALNEMLAELEK